MEQHTIAAHYATLIGINAYPESPLRGCVRDVREIKRRLEETSNSVHIQMFTASLTENSSSSRPAEDPELWPTYDNVTSALKQVTSSAKSGDFVYIHYSGHGTTINPSKESSSKSSGDLALVLIEVMEKTEIRYLRGLEFAHLLNGMVEKGLTVTLVLDCCFSGSVVRNDSLARYLVYDPKIDAAYPLNPYQSLNPEIEASRPAYRAASMRPNWLVNPDGYTILTACGPTEIAKEIILGQNGQRHGALSYYLLRAFDKLGGVGGKQQHIYHHLCARFRETRNKQKNEQNPMFYGNQSLCFFGPAYQENYSAPLPIIKRRDGRIQLEAGHAHGISNGDHFAMHPLEFATDNHATKRSLVTAIVTHVEALMSDIELIGTSSRYVETGWMATPLTRLSLRKFPIQLELSLPHPNEWTSALRERQSLDIYPNDSSKPTYPFSFYVAVDGEHEYVIRDETNQPILTVPTTTRFKEEAARHVLDVVEHLVRFKLVRDLTNTLPVDSERPFMNSFKIQLIDRAGKIYRPGCLQRGWLHPGCFHLECIAEIEHGDWLKIVVENTGRSGGNLYLHLYNMDSCWAIENILEGNHEVVSSTRGEWSVKIRMKAPDKTKERGQSYYEDIIKVFLTAQPSSFMCLELPELATPAHPGKLSETRGAGDEGLSDDWVAFNFRIRILVK